MTLQEAVWKDSLRMSGVLCFRGTRIPVSTLFDHLKADQLDEFYIDFPDVTPEMVEVVLDVHEQLLETQVQEEKAA